MDEEYRLIQIAQNKNLPEQEWSDAQNQLVIAHLGLIRSIAANVCRNWNCWNLFDELVNEGVIALIERIKSFDRNYGTRLSTYAYPRIRGAMLNFLVKQQIRPPRSLLERAREAEQVTEALTQQLGREPTVEEVATQMGLSVDQVEDAMTCLDVVVLSIEALREEGSDWEPESPAEPPGQALLRDEEYQQLEEAMDSLTLDEWLAVVLHYWCELTYKEIGLILDKSEGAVTQLMRRAKAKLRQRLETYYQTEVR
jgi:RNA polymerase sigma factor for flagellar operon FliA